MKKSAQRTLPLPAPSARPQKFEGRLQIKDIYLGSIDATDELDVGSAEAAEAFYATYYIPEGLSMNAFVKGEKFFVYGLKGTGKTSFLRYLKERLIRDGTTAVVPEIFRFDRDFAKDIYRDAQLAFFGHPNSDHIDEETLAHLDYEDAWIYIILSRIMQVAGSKSGSCFQKDDAFYNLSWLLQAITPQSKLDHVYRFLPNITQNAVTLSGELPAGIDLEFDNTAHNQISFNRYINKCLELYSQLTAVPGRNFYLLFDEIDPRTNNKLLFHTDSVLIRDLITAIRRLNTAQQQELKGVFLLAAIRSEILDHVNRLGKDVHKRLEQLGYPMNWGDVGSATRDHPLIRMICAKIAFSERKHGRQLTLGMSPDDVTAYIWHRYFRQNNTAHLDPKYLLDWTWYRPRDFIRIFDTCVEIQGDSEEISESLITRGNKRYSSKSWAEISSHLSLSLDPFAVEGVEKVLNRFDREFNLETFEARLEALSKDTHVKWLHEEHTATDIVVLLYKTGALGNIAGARTRFVFRGDSDPDVGGKLYIHRALLPRFSISMQRRQRDTRA